MIGPKGRRGQKRREEKEWVCKVVGILGICPSVGVGEREKGKAN